MSKVKSLFLLVFIVSVTVINIYAQSTNDDSEMQTLFGNKQFTFGGAGGVHVGFSKFNGVNAVLVGGRGGVIINHNLVLGGGGWGFANIPSFSNIGGNDIGYLEGGYGGVYIEPIFFAKKAVHFSLPILVGAGDLMYLRSVNRNMSDIANMIDSDPFFILEPGLELEINLFKHVRFAAGVSYHWSPNLDLIDTPANPFNGFTSSIAVKFGKF